MKVLVIDHDVRIQKTMKELLGPEFVIDGARDAETGEALAYENHYDVIVLDLVLPDMDGEDLCSLLKAHLKSTPIIIASRKTTISDKSRAFEHGADDFIEKPFSMTELRARIKAVIRRKNPKELPRAVTMGKMTYDPKKHVVMYDGTWVKLRRKEMQVLEYLLLNRGAIVTKSELLEHVWDMNIDPFTNTVEVHVKRLRDKIEKPFNEHYIETIHGVGYLIAE